MNKPIDPLGRTVEVAVPETEELIKAWNCSRLYELGESQWLQKLVENCGSVDQTKLDVDSEFLEFLTEKPRSHAYVLAFGIAYGLAVAELRGACPTIEEADKAFEEAQSAHNVYSTKREQKEAELKQRLILRFGHDFQLTIIQDSISWNSTGCAATIFAASALIEEFLADWLVEQYGA